MFTGLKSTQVSSVGLEDLEHYSYMGLTLEVVINFSCITFHFAILLFC